MFLVEQSAEYVKHRGVEIPTFELLLEMGAWGHMALLLP